MYIVFIDESGQPGGYDVFSNKLKDNSSKFFILSGFMINGDNINIIEKDLNDVKIKYGLNTTTEAKWHSSYKKLGLSLEEYKNYKSDIINIISKYKNSVISIVMDKLKCYQYKSHINNHNDLYAVALHLLMERICMEITDRHGRNTELPVLLFTDSRKNDNNNILDKELQISYKRAKNMGTNYVGFPNFAESLVFIDSEYSSGIQLADFCAGATYRYFSENDTFFLDLLKPAIREKNGKINGVGIKIY